MTSILEVSSRFGTSQTLPEPERDVDAQLAALFDPDHPKESVFLARGNGLGSRIIPHGFFVETRAEGTLITENAKVAHIFRNLDWLTDEVLAEILGYPELKADVMASPGEGAVVQTIDKNGCIVFEACASTNRLADTMLAAERQLTEGGHVFVTSIEAALARRIKGMN